MTNRTLLWLAMLFSVVAAACATPGETEDATGDDVAVETEELVFRDGPAGSVVNLPALNPDADPTSFAVESIASTPPNVTGSALRGDRTNPDFPDPLIDLDALLSGGPPPDGIPPIDEPRFQTTDSVDWLAAVEPVMVLTVEGDTRAYPIQIMTWHEIVNDTIGGVPVTVAYCPLCNSGLAYDRRVGDQILDFGTSGELFNSSLVMYDRQTETLWTHFDARAVVGELAGQRLETLSLQITSWEQFRTAHPDSLVLSLDTGFERRYGTNPYAAYDTGGDTALLFEGDDGRLNETTRVIVVRDESQPAVVLPLERVFVDGVVEFEAHGRQLVAVVEPGVSSPLQTDDVSSGFDQGAAVVFVNELDGEPLSLTRTSEGFVDSVSGLTFDIFGDAVDGSGVALQPVEHLDTFWFAIAAFEPDLTLLAP